jgi:hypothetical protein
MSRTPNVPLPDEYNQIYHGIHSFHPHRPRALALKQMQASELPDTYVFRNFGGQLSISHDFEVELSPGARRKIQAQVDLMKEIAGDIGDFDTVWSLQDTRWAYTSLDHMRVLDVARARDEGSCEFFLMT